jgi:hypothetical protein
MVARILLIVNRYLISYSNDMLDLSVRMTVAPKLFVCGCPWKSGAVRERSSRQDAAEGGASPAPTKG